MLEIIITTLVFLAAGALIGLLVSAARKPGSNNADAENRPCETKADAENPPVQAVILCSGNIDENPPVYEYGGNADCRTALAIGTGGRTCTDGCIGLGSCAKACPESAITVRKGIASVDTAACTGCGECLDVCPKHLIVLRPRNFRPGRNCVRNCPGGICGACATSQRDDD